MSKLLWFTLRWQNSKMYIHIWVVLRTTNVKSWYRPQKEDEMHLSFIAINKLDLLYAICLCILLFVYCTIDFRLFGRQILTKLKKKVISSCPIQKWELKIFVEDKKKSCNELSTLCVIWSEKSSNVLTPKFEADVLKFYYSYSWTFF